jgi:recombination protein RecA
VRKALIKKIEKSAESPPQKTKQIRVNRTLSTGSTLLDLAISGMRKRGGGIPTGTVIEIFGPSSSGKTGILAELAASAQALGGEILFQDPEGRLDKEYCEIYGVYITPEIHLMPDTVTEMIERIWTWEPTKKDNIINIQCIDSLAALSTKLEMEDEDKMGMRRAKEFSQGLRKVTRKIRKENWIIACSNQERESDKGVTTPGGRAVPYYSDIRIRVYPRFTGGKYIKKKVKLTSGKEVEKTIGIISECHIVKSSVDDPFRSAEIYILFGYGIDDIRANLQYIKDINKDTTYIVNEKSFVSMDKAIDYVEKNNLELEVKEKVIDLWEEVEKSFKFERKKKER